jgi:hypothetical protein
MDVPEETDPAAGDPRDEHLDDLASDEATQPEPADDDFVPRRETGIRIGLTILFALIAGVVETVLVVIVLFELLSALVTERVPNTRVRDFANRIVSYYYRLGRYLTYNESRVPFPFSDFPGPVEPDAFSSDDSDSRVLGISVEP